MQTKFKRGFTIVELLIVIVVIAILAAITIVAYNGIQARARDASRKSDIEVIAKALEMYYIDNGKFPGSPSQTGGSTTINSGWSTTADGSWQALVNTLQPYITKIGRDPISTPGVSIVSGNGYNYAYFASSSNYCGAAPYQMYSLVYRLESSAQENHFDGDCPSNPINYALASNYRVVK